MAALRPFRALRPDQRDARAVAAVPYDVVDAQEARALAAGNPLSFLHVSRAEIDLAEGTDPYSAVVYDRAVENFTRLRASTLSVEAVPSVYVYRLRLGQHEQTGIAGCWALEEYDRNLIKKHERTRRDKEDDRTRHMVALGAQTGPVFLTYRASDRIDAVTRRVTAGAPVVDFEALDGVRHTIWRVADVDRDSIVQAFRDIPALYIADGHHRAASAARARDYFRDQKTPRASVGDDADYTTFLAVAFSDDQVRILAYNRIVKNLGRLTSDTFLEAVRDRFSLSDGPATPGRRGEISMYFGGRWHMLRPRSRPDTSDAVRSLDVSILQDNLLAPIVGIADVATDKRIDFVGGARGTRELEALVDSRKAAVAFSLYPVGVPDLMAVVDAGAIMPPKSTWFEPKLRDGLLSHLI